MILYSLHVAQSTHSFYSLPTPSQLFLTPEWHMFDRAGSPGLREPVIAHELSQTVPTTATIPSEPEIPIYYDTDIMDNFLAQFAAGLDDEAPMDMVY